jgi:hypothetical protein
LIKPEEFGIERRPSVENAHMRVPG